MMKKLKLILPLVIAVFCLSACQTNDDLEFVANEPDSFTFSTTFLENYVLNASLGNNLAERFTWDTAYFGVPTNVTYSLQAATMEDFSDYVATENLYNLGNTTGNEIPVTVGKMIALAHAAGLDNDPNTEAPNTGVIYFRLLAVVGNEGLPTYSNVQGLNVELQEQDNSGGSGIMPSTWGVVGSGYNNWGAFEDGVFYTTGTNGVYVAYVTLVAGEIKFRENNAWDNNFGDTGADGTLDAGGDNIAVTAGTYKITLNLNDNTYTKEPFSWGIVGSGYNNWGATPDAKFYYDYTTDTFKVGVKLIAGEIKFRLNNAWDTNFGDTGADGTLENGGDNIVVTAGYYNVTLDLNNSVYTLEAGDVFGIVGSGYNNWGATPDFSLTQVNTDVWVGDIVTLVNGEIKFRVNNAWDTNYGDTGADGTIEAGGDNIAVTAGMYRVVLDIANGTYALNKVQ